MNSKHDAAVQLIARIVLYTAAACIPLAFCRETMYVFQMKTFLLQYTGIILLVLMTIHMFLSKEALNITQKWAYRFIIAFALWQIFKSWDSISPEISMRQLSRIIWLPVIAISVPWFFRTRKQIERMITVMIISALVVNAVTWLLYTETARLYVFGDSHKTAKDITDLGYTLMGGVLEWMFYPGEFKDNIIRKEGDMFPFTMYSLYPGKHDAGTFGSRNFITAYINLTSILMIYRSGMLIASICKISDEKKRSSEGNKAPYIMFALISASILVVTAFCSYWHIIELENRGSWMGLFFAVFTALVFCLVKILFLKFKPDKKTKMIYLGCFVGLISLFSMVFITFDADRVWSIFSIKDGTNELRRHTWVSYYNAWTTDKEFKGFESGFKKVMTGFGTYTFRVIYPKYRSQRIFKIEFNQHNTETSHAHNEYVGYLGELGVLGFLCYVFMIGFVLWRFVLKPGVHNSYKDTFLFAALLFAISSQLVHQLVGVSIRYTGISFQFWLTLGLILSLCWSSEELKVKEKQFHGKVLGAFSLLCLLLFLISFGLSYPVQLMRSQHFYMMGRANYDYVRHIQGVIKKYTPEYDRLLKMRGEYKKKGHYSPKLEDDLKKLGKYLEDRDKDFKRRYHWAEKYFEAGYLYDNAHVEPIYIGGNMKVQFANQALVEKKYPKAKQLFKQALVWYDNTTDVAPYFVQARYWQGVCYKGVATSMIMQMRDETIRRNFEIQNQKNPQIKMALQKQLDVETAKRSQEIHNEFEKAIKHYELYERQDPIYLDSHYDKFFVYLSIKDYKKALGTMRDLLMCFEEGGYFIYEGPGKMRFDPERMIKMYIKYAPKSDAIEALELYSQIILYKSVLEMVPSVPMTERHVTNSFEFLN